MIRFFPLSLIMIILGIISIPLHEEIHVLQMTHHENITVHGILFLNKQCGDWAFGCINYTNTGESEGITRFNSEIPAMEVQAYALQFIFLLAAAIILIRIFP